MWCFRFPLSIFIFPHIQFRSSPSSRTLQNSIDQNNHNTIIAMCRVQASISFVFLLVAVVTSPVTSFFTPRQTRFVSYSHGPEAPRIEAARPCPLPISNIVHTSSSISQNQNPNNENNSNNNIDYSLHSYPRDNFGRSLRGFLSSALKESIQIGDTVVCKSTIPSLGIYENASYELQSIYAQSFDEQTQTIVKLPVETLDDPIPSGSSLYVTLFSSAYHEKAVVVSPEEVGIGSVKNELGDAAWLALPGFFWIFVASSFYNLYHERTGGSFGDAFWGR